MTTWKALWLSATLTAAAIGVSSAAEPAAEVRATFERFVAAQNAHDAAAVSALLADSEDFLWITRGVTVWGRAEAMARFQKLYAGTWQLEPEMGGFRVVVLEDRVAEIFVPVQFTPEASTYAGKNCSGVNILLLDRAALDSPALGIELSFALFMLYPKEFELDRTLALIGSRKALEELRQGKDPAAIAMGIQDSVAAFRRIRERYLLYP